MKEKLIRLILAARCERTQYFIVPLMIGEKKKNNNRMERWQQFRSNRLGSNNRLPGVSVECVEIAYFFFN